jgi:putative ABC transport system permease protein
MAFGVRFQKRFGKPTWPDSMKNPVSPPKIFLRFFRWFCHPKMQGYIEGDLMEVYERRLKQIGKRKADLQFILDVLLLFRPGIIRPTEGYKTLNNYGMIKNYFKIGWRTVVKNKSYAAINIAGLALSMTCGILIFTLITHHLSFDSFHPNSDRLYRIVTEQHRDVIGYQSNVPSPLGAHFRNDYTLAETIARVHTVSNALITLDKGNELAKFREATGVAFTEPDFFKLFNFPLLQGDRKSLMTEPNTAVITKKMAQKYFGDKSPIGEVLMLENKVAFTITGILQDLPENTDIKSEIFVSYATLKSLDTWLADDTKGWGGIRDGMKCYTLLKPGVPPVQVEEVLQLYVKKFRPNSKNVHHYKLQPLADVHFNMLYGGAMDKQKIWIMALIGIFLILTACVNFINLATAQALKRSKEVGVRKVLGGFKGQLFWQFIAETFVITLLGIVVAIGLAIVVAPAASQLFNIQIPLSLVTGYHTVLFSIGMAIVIALLAGYYPAVILSRFQPVKALKGKMSQQRIGGFNTRRLLIVAQFVISQVLIIGTIVVMNQMKFTQQSDLGFVKDAIVMINMGSDSTYTKSSALKNEILRLPGVESVSRCFTAPASEDDWGNNIRFENNEEDENFRTSMKMADTDYLATFNLELVAGRNLTPSDTVREILVNETLVKKLGLKSADEILGRKITADGGDIVAPVVGVLKDFHDKSFHENINPILLTTISEDYSVYAVRMNMSSAQSTLQAIEEIWLAQHPDQLFEYAFLDDQIAQFYKADQTILKSIQVFSGIALFIGCLGLYGLISFMANQKTKEVGIRKVLGGSVMHIASLFGRELIGLIIVAACIAIPLGWWLSTSWLHEFKFQVGIHAGTFILAIVFTLIISLCTVSYQVIKSAFANPVKSLRNE